MHRGFSLIELSIVILIIGILIAGVTQSSRLVKQMRLSSARTMTQSSPVAGIKGLMVWLESTSEKSFLAAEAEEGVNISLWNDINPQTSYPNNVTKTASSAVQYRESGINNLPSVYFGGTLAANTFLSGTMVVPSPNNSFSLFTVSKFDDNTSTNWRIVMFNGNPSGSSSGWLYAKGGTGSPLNKRCISLYGASDQCGAATISKDAEIASATYDGTTLNVYYNGASILSNVASMNTPVAGGVLAIGGIEPASISYLGNIGEVIIFDRKLKNEERVAIEQYLGKKWGIKVN